MGDGRMAFLILPHLHTCCSIPHLIGSDVVAGAGAKESEVTNTTVVYGGAARSASRARLCRCLGLTAPMRSRFSSTLLLENELLSGTGVIAGWIRRSRADGPRRVYTEPCGGNAIVHAVHCRGVAIDLA